MTGDVYRLAQVASNTLKRFRALYGTTFTSEHLMD